MSAGKASAKVTPEAFAALEARVAELERQLAAAGKALSSSPTPVVAQVSKPVEDVPWAVIAAAVAAVVPEAHRILSIEMMGLPPMNLWSFEGRRAIFMSRTFR